MIFTAPADLLYFKLNCWPYLLLSLTFWHCLYFYTCFVGAANMVMDPRFQSAFTDFSKCRYGHGSKVSACRYWFFQLYFEIKYILKKIKSAYKIYLPKQTVQMLPQVYV